MTAKRSIAVTVEAEPSERGGLRPSTWVRARLMEVSRVTGTHRNGYVFRFASDEDEVTGTVWEPLHPGRPLHHWVSVLAGRAPEAGEELDLAALIGAVIDIYCEEETIGRQPGLQVVDLRPIGTRERS